MLVLKIFGFKESNILNLIDLVLIMSMQISVDPAGLTQEQREAVAGFILAYPSANAPAIPAFIHKPADHCRLSASADNGYRLMKIFFKNSNSLA